MENLKTLTEFFLLSLSFGLGLFSPLTKISDTGEGLAKLIHSLSGAFLILAISLALANAGQWGGSQGPSSLLYTLLLLVTLFAYLRPEKDSGFFYGLRQVLYLLLGYVTVQKNLSSYFFFLLTAPFIGSVLYSMILGHWYLVVPKLSERPLKKAVEWGWATLAAKWLFSLWGLWLHRHQLGTDSTLEVSMSFTWLILSMRFLWGYVLLFILSIFAWKLVKMRSIQSATGILYTMVFFLLIGELISAYLFYQYGFAI